MTRVVTIVVTYNGSRWIKRCLEHLLESDTRTDIILLDNKSTDDTYQILVPFLDKIDFVQLPSNLGFGGANNIGLKRALEAGYTHIFLLNQDAYIQQDCISKLLATLQSEPDFGIISPVQLDPSGLKMDGVFHNQVKKHYSPDGETLLNQLKSKNIARAIEVRFVGAASWFISAEMIKKVGGFHPVFFHYGEDNNLAARAQYFGFKIGVQATTAMIHDRKIRDNKQFLPIKLRSFPLHQLLDIRKPFALAWIVGYNQLVRTWKKLQKTTGDQYNGQYLEAKKWFFNEIKKAKAVREEMKKGLPRV